MTRRSRGILVLAFWQTHVIAQEMSLDDRMKAGEETYTRADYGLAERHWKAGL